MIPLQEQEAIRKLFAETLKEPVKIDLFTQRPTAMLVPGREDCRFCAETQHLLEELSAINASLRLTVHELGADPALDKRLGVTHVPATVLRGVLNRPVTFYGLPFGYLLPPFVETLVLMSRNHVELPAPALKKLKRLREPVTLRLFVTPDSEYCGPMLSYVFALAIENKLIKAEAIEVAEFPRLAERYGVKQVPFTVINDRAAFPGAVELEPFIDQIIKTATTRTLSAPPRSGATTQLRSEAPRENVRPSGLIIPGR